MVIVVLLRCCCSCCCFDDEKVITPVTGGSTLVHCFKIMQKKKKTFEVRNLQMSLLFLPHANSLGGRLAPWTWPCSRDGFTDEHHDDRQATATGPHAESLFLSIWTPIDLAFYWERNMWFHTYVDIDGTFRFSDFMIFYTEHLIIIKFNLVLYLFVCLVLFIIQRFFVRHCLFFWIWNDDLICLPPWLWGNYNLMKWKDLFFLFLQRVSFKNWRFHWNWRVDNCLRQREEK